MKKWIFFDVGSTLVDERETYRLFSKRCVETLSSAGRVVTLDEFEEKLVEYSRKNQDPIRETWSYFTIAGVERPQWNHSTDCLYPDTKAVLEQLQRDYRMGVIANQKENLAERLENWGIADYFQLVLSSSVVGYSKPDVRIFSSALELAGVLPQEVIYIGDRIDNDMIPAKKLGMTTIWLQAGLGKYNQEDVLYKVDWVVSSLTEVVDVLIK